MNRITQLQAWEALDSRGVPTVAVRLELADGSAARATVPAGASAGSHEARELRDGGDRYRGRGVRRAVAGISEFIAPRLRGLDGDDPAAIDALLATLDPEPGFATLGANAALAVSLAAWQASATSIGASLARRLDPAGALELPMPMINIVSGGAHAGGAIDIQDVLVIPHGADSFATAIEWAVAIRTAARDLAVDAGYPEAVLVADEGGLGVRLPSNRSALELVTEAIELAGLVPGRDASLAVDVAASELLVGDTYTFASEGRVLQASDLIQEIAGWAESFPLISVEDALGEDEWDGWRDATVLLGDLLQLIGDDLFVTDPARLARGVASGAANAVLVKVNQNGTVSGGAEVMTAARAAGYATIVSARSGETEESWLADLAVGWRAGQIKVGSTHRSERTAKWNRLLELEATEHTTFAGPWGRDESSGRIGPRRGA